MEHSEAILALENIALDININRLTCEVTIEEADFNADSLTHEAKQLVDAHIGAIAPVLSDRQYIEAFLQAILQKFIGWHRDCVERV